MAIATDDPNHLIDDPLVSVDGDFADVVTSAPPAGYGGGMFLGGKSVKINRGPLLDKEEKRQIVGLGSAVVAVECSGVGTVTRKPRRFEPIRQSRPQIQPQPVKVQPKAPPAPKQPSRPANEPAAPPKVSVPKPKPYVAPVAPTINVDPEDVRRIRMRRREEEEVLALILAGEI